MPNILIISEQDDPHARAVTWGLHQLGHAPACFSWSDFPRNGSSSVHLGRNGASRAAFRMAGAAAAGPFDTIWVRRRTAPAPMAGTHPDDQALVLAESRLFLETMLSRLGHARTRWVDHPDNLLRCRDKLTQLEAAHAVGFRIPETLVGNDIAAVREFFRAHPGGIVHKSLTAMNWQNDDGSRTTGRTSLLAAEHLEQAFAVRACPAMYQEKIEKNHELRVTVIGDRVLAARIDSQRDGPSIDWRYDGVENHCKLHRTGLAPELAQRCLALCRRLGLAFGCIDLVVTPSGDVVFLEINCSGQFLFKELADPGLPMLETFCCYLAEETGTGDVTMARYLAWEQARQQSEGAAA